MFNDIHRPLQAAALCIPFLAGLAIAAALLRRVISAFHSKQPATAEGLFAHMLTIVIMLGLTAVLALRTWNMEEDARFLSLGSSTWQITRQIIAFAIWA